MKYRVKFQYHKASMAVDFYKRSLCTRNWYTELFKPQHCIVK